jgi:hypothetical protein
MRHFKMAITDVRGSALPEVGPLAECGPEHSFGNAEDG